MNFKEKQDFLSTLYPYRDKTYHVKLWRTHKKNFYWESKGKFTEKTLMGCFNIADDSSEAIKAAIEYIIYKQPTPKERDLLMKYGLLDKLLWKDSDINRAEAIIEFCNADLNFVKNQM